MTVRSGGGPRDPKSHARPYAEDAYATEAMSDPDPSRYGRSQRSGGRGSHGVVGLVKFLVFAVVLAAIVLVVSLTALRPVFNNTILSWAAENPAALQLPFVKDLVREDLGAALTTPASTDPAQVEFIVEAGDTASTIGARLATEGLITDPRTFVFLAIDQKRTGDLQQGTFVLRKNMTPDQLVTALLAAPEIKYIDIGLRTSLRLEQITAKLQTLDGLEMDPQDFYDLTKTPPPGLVADYPWLKKILATAPKGASLEGFLWPATYRVLPDTTAEELVRLMLDGFALNVGEDRMDVPKERGLTFYEVLTLASIVEREAVLDEERPIIAGVYQLRIDGYKGIAPILNSDPTVFYAIDTLELAKLPFDEWQNYAFWAPPGTPLKEIAVPEDLQGYQTYQTAGLIPGPIDTPSLPSLDAALDPNVADGYIYFVAIPDGGGKHDFAKSYKEHQANLKKYGY
jgi:UPF0755 protein